ncbi:hypothetical protein [Azospirillum sp. TSO35-2]|uniref:hypothetical protein n=1 Tax=Azospirillum sp. TSO35-2 TaxID=716796 RepID=UPI000D612EE3|nr:hypothetical protein [Azospirillum sp. TSO35-2]PWC37449.1 hypothetical protein TSO352_07755 [Azospirillum sp. TSO35-2]
MDRKPDETTLTASLPNLEIQIIHRDCPEENAEVIAIQFRATPSFDAMRGLLAPSLMTPLLLGGPGIGAAGMPSSTPLADLWLAPMRLWGEMVRQAWAPWLNATKR